MNHNIERAKKLQEPSSFLLDVIDRVEVDNKYTVEFILMFSPFPTLAAFTISLSVLPNVTNLDEKPIGTEPCQIRVVKKVKLH